MDDELVQLRPEIALMVPYRQGRAAAIDAFKLSSNENPHGPLPAVVEALAQSSVNRYPDAAATELRTRLAQKFGLTLAQVHVGAGSVSIIAQLISAAAAAGDEVIYAWRSFEAYPGLVAVAGATSVQVPNRADHRHDLAAMAAAVTDRTRVILVCSPNNPTGSMVTGDEFAQFMADVPANVLVVLDEAYVEFITDATAVRGESLLDTYANLVVLRTFSKAYGLAGLRIGYALGAEYLMNAARATAIPLSVTEPAQLAAIASLDHEDELLARVQEISTRRDELWIALQAQGWDIPRPHGNFLWFPTGTDTADAFAVFESHGIVARSLPPEGLRVTVGEAASVEKLLKASAEVVGKLRTAPSRATLD
jgi:histidinol-phosphate aminotransferase